MIAQYVCPLKDDCGEVEVEVGPLPIESPTCPVHHAPMLLAGIRDERQLSEPADIVPPETV